jgi:hypothetical protein
MLEKLAALAPVPKRASVAPVPAAVLAIPRIEKLDRARKYLAMIPGAVSGQRGHDRTFHVACVLIIRFGLAVDEAYPLFAEWNQRCDPPWGEYDLRRKLTEADKQPGPRGELLAAERESASPSSDAPRLSDAVAKLLAGDSVTPSASADDMSDLAKAFSKLGPYCSDCDNYTCDRPKPYGRCGCPAKLPLPLTPESASELRVCEKPLDFLNTRNSDALRALIGPPPQIRYCPRPVTRFAVGISERTCGCDAAFQMGCGRFRCDVCRERKVYKLKREQIPRVFAHCTHVWTGTIDEWEATRKRMDRADVKRTHFAMLQAEDRLAVVVAVTSDPETVPESVGLTRVTDVEAAQFFVLALDAIPDAEEGVKVKRFRPGRGWKELESPALIPSSGNPPATDDAESEIKEVHWRFVDGAMKCRAIQIPAVLSEFAVDCNIDSMIDAGRGGPVERTVVWEAPDSIREEVRAAIVSPRKPKPNSEQTQYAKVMTEAESMRRSLREQYRGREDQASDLIRMLLA